jgi:hypothetical protein
MTINPPHAVIVELVRAALQKHLPKGWHIRTQQPIIAIRSVPEPDVAAVLGPPERYFHQHPQSKEVALVVEVADTTLEKDRTVKARIYARSRLPVYWIVNLIDGCLEVYTQPKRGRSPSYLDQQTYRGKETVPFLIEDRLIRKFPFREFLPDIAIQ